jgi:phosphoenolpyruvate-protein kinase (PTS system EI component)
MTERVFRGAPASPGLAAGPARLLDVRTGPVRAIPPEERERERALIVSALEGAALEIDRLAERLSADGRQADAEIVATGALMARDPALAASAEEGVSARGLPAPEALIEAAETHASSIAALADATLAARADDVRSLGRRAARLAREPAGGAGRAAHRTTAREGVEPASVGEVVLVARDLGPADVSELGAEVAGIALAAGAVTAHAAIVARSLGIPMVIGAGEELLETAAGVQLVVDGDGGEVVSGAGSDLLAAAADALAERARARARRAEQRDLPAVTRDGRAIHVLANAVSPAEIALALDAGAEGAGLIRTELAFLDAPAWPSEEQHIAALTPVLTALAGRTATVRVLDFGGDKTPPFLNGRTERGVELLLANQEAFAAQLRAIVSAGAGTELRLLVPLVSAPEQIREARALACEAVAARGAARMPLRGAMVELPEAAERAAELVAEVDFVSIGTNDLTATTLGLDRFAAGAAPAHHPRVLGLVAKTVRAARAAGIPVEVCGEAASDPLCVPLLVGLGADELSVGAARVGTVREWVRGLEFGEAVELAERALTQADAPGVARLVEPLGLGENGRTTGAGAGVA